MRKAILPLVICLIGIGSLQAQNESKMDDTMLPYREIPAYPETFTAETVAARMIDGLGFRYYWATEGLRPEDLAYQPGAEARTSEETLDHILGLTNMILNSVLQQVNGGDNKPESPTTFAGKRKKTLENLKQASDILKRGEAGLEDYPIVFQRGENRSELPFWNQINGPIADAIWHVGQVVSFRRASGNPFNSKVSVMMGTVRE